MNLHQFERWLVEVEPVEMRTGRLDYPAWTQKNDRGDWAGYVRHIRDSFETIAQHSDGRITLNGAIENAAIEISPSDPNSDFMPALRISGHRGPATLKNFGMKQLTIDNAINSEFAMDNLVLSNLILDRHSSASYALKNCFIGALTLRENCAHNFAVYGGAILTIDCPPPTGDNPFTGSVHFDRSVYLPHKSGKLLRGAQPYRNLRSHMMKLQNAPMVGRFHRLEQLVERENLTRFDRLLSRGYGGLSNYGSSSLRPIMWLASLIFVTFVLGLSDGVAASNDLAGWQTGLRGAEFCARVERAFVLAMQATVNPLGVFGIRGAIFAKSGWFAFWLTLHGLSSTLLIALFIFAVRRRFKVT